MKKPYAIAGAVRDEVIALAKEVWPKLDAERVSVLKSAGPHHMVGRRHGVFVGKLLLQSVGPYRMAFHPAGQVLSVMLPPSPPKEARVAVTELERLRAIERAARAWGIHCAEKHRLEALPVLDEWALRTTKQELKAASVALLTALGLSGKGGERT